MDDIQATRRASDTGGSFGHLESRLLEALRRSVPKMPQEMQAAFAALLSPESLTITLAVLVAWVGSHAAGVGEIVDVGLLSFGLITLGAMAIDVSKHLSAFLTLVISAKTSKDLDEAADHFAEAVSILGVTLFTSLLMKHAGKVGGELKAVRVVRAPIRYFNYTVEEWLYQLQYYRLASSAIKGTETTLQFLSGKQNFVNTKGILGWLKGMDLSKPVAVRQLNAGDKLIGYFQLKPLIVAKIKANPKNAADFIRALKPEDLEFGSFFTKPGTASSRLGIADQNRIFVKLKLNASVSALESTTAPIKDTWTVRAGGTTTAAGNTWYNGQLVNGGGTQYLVPDAKYLYITKNAFQIIEIGSNVTLY